MIKRYYKIFISVILIVTLSFAFCAQAHAIVGAAVGGAALLSGGLSAVGVNLAVTAGVTYIGYQIINDWINNGYSIKGILTGVADGYIKVNNDSVIVDGVEYQSIFLSPEMAQELHTQAFDFITANAIQSNDSGILYSGVGTIDGLPVYYDGTYGYTQTYLYPYDLGSFAFGSAEIKTTASTQNPNNHKTVINVNGGSNTLVSNYNTSAYPLALRFRISNPTATNPSEVFQSQMANQAQFFTSTYPGGTPDFTYEEFEFDYISGTIDATPLASDEGFQLFVPTSQLSTAGINPGTYINDVGTGTDTISLLIDLLDTIDSQFLLNPEFTDVIDPPGPTPTPVPIPTDALGSVPYPDFIDTFGQSVYDRLDNIEDTVDTVGQSITDELEYQSAVFDTIGLAIDSIESAVTDIVDGIQVKVGEIADTLVDIKDGIIEAIEEGPIKLIDSGLDVLRSVFGSILQTIRSHVGIWHYVVSWVQSISTPFTWILGIAKGTSYYMVLPLYAVVAGTLIIAIYKRFGR